VEGVASGWGGMGASFRLLSLRYPLLCLQLCFKAAIEYFFSQHSLDRMNRKPNRVLPSRRSKIWETRQKLKDGLVLSILYSKLSTVLAKPW